MNSVQENLVFLEDTIRDALARLQSTGRGVVLLVDGEGRLLRTVTDGDIRRQLLAGAELSMLLSDLPVQIPIVDRMPCTKSFALAVMRQHKIDQLPLLDSHGRPVELLLRRDLDSQILLSTPHLGTNEMAYVEEAFRTNWIAPLGPNVDAFEQELAAYIGCRHAAALSSGTAGIHLALRLLGVKPGDEVFCSSLTFVASANPILYEQATPVFIDSDPSTWNISIPALSRALEEGRANGRLPKAVLAVNLYGQSADMDPLTELCNEYKVPLIEDAAESLGASYKGRSSGTFGRLAVFSFNGNKIITTSGGGMIVSDDAELIARARHLSTQAREPASHYEHTEIGYNYRMSNVLAGIGRGQLQVLEQRVAARRRVFDLYRQKLKCIGTLEWMPEADYGLSTRWLTAATLAQGIPVTEVIERLKIERIEARRVWKPMHLQPLFAGCRYYQHEDGKDVSADLFDRGICLPSGSNMVDEQLERVVDVLNSVLTSYLLPTAPRETFAS
jgi:dTDP-4-amino-4,6-dideoxygalactose transaminase